MSAGRFHGRTRSGVPYLVTTRLEGGEWAWEHVTSREGVEIVSREPHLRFRTLAACLDDAENDVEQFTEAGSVAP